MDRRRNADKGVSVPFLAAQGAPHQLSGRAGRPASVSLTATNKSVATKLSILPAAAVLPLGDNYTALVQASAAGGSTGYAPIRLLMRSAMFTSITKIGCNSPNQMDVSLSWQINGFSVSSLWI